MPSHNSKWLPRGRALRISPTSVCPSEQQSFAVFCSGRAGSRSSHPERLALRPPTAIKPPQTPKEFKWVKNCSKIGSEWTATCATLDQAAMVESYLGARDSKPVRANRQKTIDDKTLV
eukprot:954196-Amphidinium_carterae.1